MLTISLPMESVAIRSSRVFMVSAVIVTPPLISPPIYPVSA